MQAVLGTEFGGMNEVLAELHARTGEPRWLALARRFHHHAVLDPLMAERDELSFLHANTQIPKVIGLARLSELDGDAAECAAPRFFWRAVTDGRSYVIGGNSDRENFQEPNSISRYITEQTCESCNTYNMLKLTRHLYAAEPDAAYFDYYERAHLNHILAQQRRTDGMFAYMVPLMSGTAREWSEPFDSFWCCVGTGMESHAKHGDSIYWSDAEALFVNLYIPSELAGTSAMPRSCSKRDIRSRTRAAARRLRARAFDIAMRIPAWCTAPRRTSMDALAVRRDERGYFACTGDGRRATSSSSSCRCACGSSRRPMIPRRSRCCAVRSSSPQTSAPRATFDGPEPALVGDDPCGHRANAPPSRRLRDARIGRPADLPCAVLQPARPAHGRLLQALHARRVAGGARAARCRARARRGARCPLPRHHPARHRGRETHGLSSDISYAVSYRFRPGRDARTGGFLEFDAAVREEPLVLRATYWGGERDRLFHIEVDGLRIATQPLEGERPGEFIERDYALPVGLPAGKQVRIRFQPEPGHTAGPIFGCRIIPMRLRQVLAGVF